MNQELRDLVSRAIVALEPYSKEKEIVLAGAVAVALYRELPRFRRPDHSPLLTFDADFVVPSRLAGSGRPSIPKLLGNANIVAVRPPSLTPGVAGSDSFQDARHGTERLGSVFLEFLAPGRHEDVRLVHPQPDLHIKALKDLAILFHEPLEIDASTVAQLAVPRPAILLLARPSTLVLQKVRIHRFRNTKKENDLASIYEAALVSQPSWGDERASLDRLRDKSGPWAGIVEHALRDLRHLAADPSVPPAIVRILRAAGAVISEGQVERVLDLFIQAMTA